MTVSRRGISSLLSVLLWSYVHREFGVHSSDGGVPGVVRLGLHPRSPDLKTLIVIIDSVSPLSEYQTNHHVILEFLTMSTALVKLGNLWRRFFA